MTTITKDESSPGWVGDRARRSHPRGVEWRAWRAVRSASGPTSRRARRPLQDLFGLPLDAVRELVGEPGARRSWRTVLGVTVGLAADLLRQGWYDAVNYVGSWHEWSRDDELDVEAGWSAGGDGEKWARAPQPCAID